MAYIMHGWATNDRYSMYKEDAGVLQCWEEKDVLLEGSRALHAMVTHQQASHQDGLTCFASVLEQDIATLEAEAQRDGHASWAFVTDQAVGSCETALDKAMSDDLGSCDHDQASDSGSASDSEQPENAALSQIQANAHMVQECGKPLQLGAWKGCCKSPWCDREDRHRGLCNHKATIPGPAACSAQPVDTCSSESQLEACCAGPLMCGMQQQADALSSGGHSHNCHTHETADGDEREVASALKTGASLHHQQSMEDTSVPFCLPQQPQQHQPAQQEQAQQQQQLPELFCFGCSSSSRGQATDQQLFALPALYQPRVKDLESPDISSILSGDGLCSMDVGVALDVPVQPVQLEDLDTSTVDTSSQTFVKPGTPSSPSCASAAAMADSAAFAVQLQVPVSAVLPLSLVPAASMVPAAPVAVPAAAVRLTGMLPLEEVHPPSSSAAAFAAEAAPAVAAAAAEAVAAAAEETPSLSADGEAATAVAAATADEIPEPDAPAAVAPAADAPAAGTNAAVPNSSSASKKAAGSKASKASSKQQASAAADTPSGTPAAAAAAASALPPPMMRVPRIKHKPRRADDPPRNLLEPSSSSSSPKSKKRPAGRMAPAPSSGHSCTQCGAVSTPVWRAGPAGPKTLCNACGVRYMKTARRK